MEVMPYQFLFINFFVSDLLL